jgi:hypothetical protein
VRPVEEGVAMPVSRAPARAGVPVGTWPFRRAAILLTLSAGYFARRSWD